MGLDATSMLSVDEKARQKFESAWRSGKPEPIEGFLPPADHPLYLATLEELIHIEMEFAWKFWKQPEDQGQATRVHPPVVEAYLSRFACLKQPAVIERLLQQEYLVRQRYGDDPSFVEYRVRFPDVEFTNLARRMDPQTERSEVGNSKTLIPAGRSLAADPEAPPAPQRYTRLRLHGQGGLGSVWVARDEDLGREVALKELRPLQAADPDARRRFVREAQVTGQLEHPNIVPVYEMSYGPDDGQPFYAMRLIQGRTLREAVAAYHGRRRAGKADTLELPRLLTVFVNICQALAYAHARGVIHRDLKPANVVLGDFGEVIVLDWGLAKVIAQGTLGESSSLWLTKGARPDATSAGSLLGTPAYMAPEQARGTLEEIDARTDIYGLGAILFEILTGQSPHRGKDTGEIVQRIVTEPSPRAGEVQSSVPKPLEAVCAKAMAKEPSDRYPSATALAEDVQRYLADEPVSVYAERWTQRLGRWTRRHKTWAVALAAALSAGVVTASWAAWQQAQMADKERQARLAAEKAQQQGLRMAAKFAARTVAGEIQLRWHILEAEAEDQEVRHFLAQLQKVKKPLAHSARAKLQTWLEARHDEHSLTAKATSWVILDHQGTMLARSPLDKRTLGQNWAFRSYFHGQDQNFAPGTKVPPLEQAHHSRVFESKATATRMVAFSVPIWSDKGKSPKRHVLGVLGMTVELGHFGALHVGPDQVAVLVDTREDWLEGKGQRGLILHHPRLVEWRLQPPPGQGKLPVFRLDPSWMPRLNSLRAQAMAQTGAREQLDADKQLLNGFPPLAESWEPAYQDPVGGPYAGGWFAALEPVFVPGRPENHRDTGWVVIIQERVP